MKYKPKDNSLMWVPGLGVSDGFTLIEIIIVVMVMGIISTISIPAITETLQNNRLRGAAGEVVNTLEYAQWTAMSSGRETRVVIGDNERIELSWYTINADLFNGGDELAAADVESGAYQLMPYPSKKGINYPVIFTNENRFEGVDITGSDFSTGNEVDFDTQGSPSKGGTATLALGGSQIVVTLEALTGKVTVSE